MAAAEINYKHVIIRYDGVGRHPNGVPVGSLVPNPRFCGFKAAAYFRVRRLGIEVSHRVVHIRIPREFRAVVE
jgi:hypothetical protein